MSQGSGNPRTGGDTCDVARSGEEGVAEPAAFRNYWRRKKLLERGAPHFPVCRWWPSADLCESERIYFDSVKGASSLLDVGAGDLRIKAKFRSAGYRGEYHTVDVGREHSHTYRDLAEVSRRYAAILLLDVIEHLPLSEGVAMLEGLVELLDGGGTLVVVMPNARCIRNPFALDMTHLHCYNINDLWAYLTSLGLETQGWRIVFGPPPSGPLQRVKLLAAAYVTSRVSGCDYADGIALIARKPAAQESQ
jgi:hypothetical protein